MPAHRAFVTGACELRMKGESAETIVEEDVHLRFTASRATAERASFHANVIDGIAIEIPKYNAWRGGNRIRRQGKWDRNNRRGAKGSVAVAEENREVSGR